METIVLLESKEEKVFEVTKEQCFRSATIKRMWELLDQGESEEIPKVPCPELTSEVLEKVVEWLKGHVEDGKWSTEEAKDYKVVDEWDRQWFANMELRLHFEVIKAANYLDIPRLMDNSCKLIAAMMAGQSVEHVRDIFGIVNDYTPEEEDAIKRENAWLED